jgi:hypothetical protein
MRSGPVRRSHPIPHYLADAGIPLVISLLVVCGALLAGGPEPALAQPPPGRCTTTLTLVSIEVLNDTEVGNEEWSIATFAYPPFGEATTVSVNADVGQGVVPINAVVASDTLSSLVFPREGVWISAIVTELDPVANEFGSNAVTLGFALACPDSRSITFDVFGQGIDPGTIPLIGAQEDFLVRLTYRWDVIAGQR